MKSTPAIETLMESAVKIAGGWHIKDLGDGRSVDVMKMLFNYRIVTRLPGQQWTEHGWCYFGHGVDENGVPRTMTTAFVAAVLAAIAWDGSGEPPDTTSAHSDL